MCKMMERYLLSAAVISLVKFIGLCSGVAYQTESKWLHAPDWDGYVFEHVGTTFHHGKMPQVRCAFLCDKQNDCDYFFHTPDQCQLNTGSLEYIGKVKDDLGVKPVGDAKCFIKQQTSCFPHKHVQQSGVSITYAVSNQSMTFAKAKEYCKYLQCTLAEPRSMQALYDTKPYITQEFGSDGSNDPSIAFWLGAQYSNECHHFVWDSDSSIVSSIWFESQPDKLNKPHSSESQDTNCVVSVPYFDYRSDDNKCTYSMYPLCECRGGLG